jgi:small-conductance mechanosensitive channel
MEFFGVELVGFHAENGRKLLLTLLAVALLWGIGKALVFVARPVLRQHGRAFFWARQGVRLAVAVLMVLAVVSIWFDDPSRLATGLGLVTAGLAFALQKLITALAGYFVILRGQTFNVGDRITMGGVRGDVIALSFTQTTITEMGQPPAVQGADPAHG